MTRIFLVLGVLSLVSWIYLLAFRGGFWRCDQRLAVANEISLTPPLKQWPSVCAIIPARNEASVLPQSLLPLLTQQYPGSFRTVLVDDQSTDGTTGIAQAVAQKVSHGYQTEVALEIITTDPLPSGWSGKLWALHQGVQQALQHSVDPLPDYFLFTDADILHSQHNVRQLVTKAEQEQLDLVSLMVLLRCQSFWEKLLIPAFVFFFQKLYPFPWVNDPQHPMAAAAGGCVLVRREALMQVGGIEVIRKALIDDCALGAAIKGAVIAPHQGATQGKRGRIWLGLTTMTISLRPYASLSDIWRMVARTAFTQLSYSFGLLFVALLSMGVVYAIAPITMLIGWKLHEWPLILVAGITWGLMAIAYWPTIQLYRLSPLRALSLPLIGILYTFMTLDSALQHLKGKGGAWKGRVYSTEAVK